jgi:hypothetical protein
MKLKTALHQAQDITFIQKLPSTLLVSITPSDVLAAVTDNISSYAVINKKGRVTEVLSQYPTDLFVLQVQQKYALGQDIEEDLRNFLQTFLEYGKTLPYTEVLYSSKNEISIRLKSGKTAIVRAEDLKTQLNTLQLLLNEATMIEKASVIDLRFPHPVLK